MKEKDYLRCAEVNENNETKLSIMSTPLKTYSLGNNYEANKLTSSSRLEESR